MMPLSALLLAAATAAPSPVPWAEARTAVAEPICAMVHKIPDGREGYSVITGMREYCKLPAASTPLQRAVDKAFEQAERLTASIHPEGLRAAYEEGLSPDERTRRARDAYLSSEDFLRAVVPRLCEAMTEEGLACVGCPEFPPRPVRKVPWSEFAPYLAAYVWPDPVHTPKAEDGKPLGKADYSFHVCVGLNGIGEMKDPDPLLVRAGFLAVSGNGEFLERASAHFDDVLSAPEFKTLGDYDARTRYLREHFGAETVKDTVARAAACHALAEVSADLALEVPDCLEAQAAPERSRPR